VTPGTYRTGIYSDVLPGIVIRCDSDRALAISRGLGHEWNRAICKAVVRCIRLRPAKGASALHAPTLRHLYDIIIYRYGVLALISRGSNF